MGVRYYWGIVERSSDGFYTHFPDLPGATAAGDTIEASLTAAADVAAYHIQQAADQGQQIPDATPLEKLPQDPEVDEYTRSLVAVPVPSKAVRINISMDEGLLQRIDSEAAAVGSNRSAFLAEAARDRLAGHGKMKKSR